MSENAFKKNFVTSYPFRTVCEVLREIYWHTDDEVIRRKVQEATVMAKKMDAKLREYKEDWDAEDMWEPLENELEIKVQRRKQYEEETK